MAPVCELIFGCHIFVVNFIYKWKREEAKNSLSIVRHSKLDYKSQPEQAHSRLPWVVRKDTVSECEYRFQKSLPRSKSTLVHWFSLSDGADRRPQPRRSLPRICRSWRRRQVPSSNVHLRLTSCCNGKWKNRHGTKQRPSEVVKLRCFWIFFAKRKKANFCHHPQEEFFSVCFPRSRPHCVVQVQPSSQEFGEAQQKSPRTNEQRREWTIYI